MSTTPSPSSATSMWPPPRSDAFKELVRLYSLAHRGEHNLAAHLRAHPEVAAALGVDVDPVRDDAELALVVAPAIGKYKLSCSRAAVGERDRRAEEAGRRLGARARHDGQVVLLDADLLLGPMSTGSHDFLAFELESTRVVVPRRPLARGRVVLRGFLDLVAFLDPRGLHLRWKAGRGGLNFRPHAPPREAGLLVVDLRRPAPRRASAPASPVLLAEVLADLGLM